MRCVVNSVTLHITYRLFGLITVYMTVFGLSDLKHCGDIFSLARCVYFASSNKIYFILLSCVCVVFKF